MIAPFSFNYSINLPNTSEEQERLDNLLQLTLATRYLQNEDTLLPAHRVYTIADYSDPRWQNLVARNYENMIRVFFHTGTPENTRVWASTYAYNGELRLQKTSSRFNNNNADATIYAEDFSAVTGMVEGAGQSLAPYLWDATNGEPSYYAYSISTVPALLNLGTGQNAAKTSIVPKNYYSLTIHGEAQTFSYKGEYSFNDFISLFDLNFRKIFN